MTTMSATAKDACEAYHAEVHACELCRWFTGEMEEINRWRDCSTFFDKLEVHHLCGHGRVRQRNWFCCLIKLCDACHKTCHKFPEAEILCWRHKLSIHRTYRECDGRDPTPLITDETRLHWNPEAVDRAIKIQPTLAGRINYLLGKKHLSATFRNYAHDILSELGEA